MFKTYVPGCGKPVETVWIVNRNARKNGIFDVGNFGMCEVVPKKPVSTACGKPGVKGAKVSIS